MFVLGPKGPGGSGGSGGGTGEVVSQNIWHFGQLSIYFLLLRGAYLYFAGREENTKTLTN